MKKIVLAVIAFLLSINTLFAECSAWYTTFFPSEKKLASNGLIIFQGYQGAMMIVRDLNKKYPIYLQSGNHKVRLEVIELNEGYATLQAILKPTEALKVELEYELIVENYQPMSKDYMISKYDYSTQKHEKPTWKIEKAIPNNLEWIKKPIVTKKSYEEFGCGPAIHVDFDFEVKSQNTYFIKAIIIDSQNKAKSTYWLEIGTQKSKLDIGHGMCSGNFNFQRGDNYEITFDMIDNSGKIFAWKEKPVQFSRPTPQR